MKKFIIVLIMLTFLISIRPVFAATPRMEVEKTFVCLEGGDYEEYLKFDGYQEVRREVNFHQTGEYYIIYRKNDSATEITKKIVVLSRSELLNQGYYENKIYPITNPSSLASTPTATLSLEDGRWIVAYGISDRDNREAGSKILIALGDGNQIKWQKVLRSDAYGAIENLAWDNGYIVGVGTLYNDITRNDGWLVVIDEFGSLVCDQIFGGSGHDYFNFIDITGDEYLIGAKSNSTDSVFVGDKQLMDSIIIAINKESYQVEYLYNIGNEGNDELVGFLYNGGYFYAIQKTTTTKIMTQIIKLSLSGEVVSVNELNFPNDLAIIKMKENNRGDIYFLAKYYSYQYQHDLIALYQLNGDLSLKEIDVHKQTGEKQVRALDFNFLVSDEIVIYYHIRTSDNNFGYQLKIKKLNETRSFIEVKIGDYQPTAGLVTPDAAVLLMNSKTGQLAIARNNNVNAYSLGKEIIENKSESVYDYEILINNKIVNHQAESKLAYNPDVFGTYLLKYYFDAPSLTLAYYIDLYVDLVVSVKDHQTYDVNTKLIFNGEGLLNNQRIASNYLIKEPGEYILEVTGRDNRKKFINFTVKNLSVNQEPITYHQTEVGILDLFNSNIDDELTINYQKELSQEPKLDFSNQWFWGFPILSGLIIVYSLVRRRWSL